MCPDSVRMSLHLSRPILVAEKYYEKETIVIAKFPLKGTKIAMCFKQSKPKTHEQFHFFIFLAGNLDVSGLHHYSFAIRC